MIYGGFSKGEYKSEYLQDGFASLVNVDKDTKLGTIKGQLVLVLDSATPNENAVLVTVPSGIIFAVSTTSGKIWQRAIDGTWTLVNTNANGANIGAGFFNNRLWYFTTTKLGYFDLSSTWSDSFGTFTNTVSTRPFLEGGVNRAFAYIGDGSQIARVDKDNTFSANVLEIPLGETITDIEEWGNDLVLTAIGAQTKIYRWNQSGDTFYKPDLIAYKDVDMLIQSQNSNIIYALCRTKDDYVEFMYYTGSELDEVAERRISTTTAANSFMKTEFDGRIHFAVGTKIYTIRNNALVCEYTAVSAIQSLCTNGSNMFVSCGTDGVYKVGTNRANFVIQTPVFEGKAKNIFVYYDTIPAGTSITGKVKINGGSWTDITLTKEEQFNRYVLSGGLPSQNTNFIQVEITGVASTTLTPIIRSIEIL
jgi:hypothetical protein